MEARAWRIPRSARRVVLALRHGDRNPLHAANQPSSGARGPPVMHATAGLSLDDAFQRDCAEWAAQLAPAPGEDVAESFPCVIAGTSDAAPAGHDELTAEATPSGALGLLTRRGAEHLRARGAYLAAGPLADWLEARAGSRAASPASVGITASNYARTRRSAQELAFGLTRSAPAGALVGRAPVQSHPKDVCPIAVFESALPLATTSRRLLRSAVPSSEDARIRQSLVESIPFFQPDAAAPCSGASYGSTGRSEPVTARRFMWIRAADMLAAAHSHGKFGLLPAGLREAAPAVIDHLRGRFLAVFADAACRRYAVATPLLELTCALLGGGAGASDVSLFGGHDVTLMPLAVALCGPGEEGGVAWPPYGAVVAACTAEDEAGTAGGDDAERVLQSVASAAASGSDVAGVCSAQQAVRFAAGSVGVSVDRLALQGRVDVAAVLAGDTVLAPDAGEAAEAAVAAGREAVASASRPAGRGERVCWWMDVDSKAGGAGPLFEARCSGGQGAVMGGQYSVAEWRLLSGAAASGSQVAWDKAKELCVARPMQT